MNKAVIGIVLLLVSGLAGAFLYIRKLRAKSAESARKLQAATSQVTSLQSDMKKREDVSEELEQEKKARKAELTRIAAERKAEKARRDALEKMKNAKIAELSAKQKSQEAKLAKTDAQRKAALREANAQRARANAERNKAKRAIADARRSKQLADQARRVADQRAKKITADARRQMSDMRRRADAEIRKQRAQSQRMISDIKRRADAEIRKERARKKVAQPLRPVRKAGRQIRAIGKIGGDPFQNAARYGAVPGYYRRGYKWAGDQFNVSDPNKCKAIARKKGLAVWGHRNALHPNKRYKNSCYFYRSGPKYAGDRNDKIHMIGCTFGGNPRTGCVTPVKKVVKMVGGGVRRF